MPILHVAIDKGQITSSSSSKKFNKCVKSLIDNRAKLEMSIDGMTPVMVACLVCNDVALKYILEKLETSDSFDINEISTYPANVVGESAIQLLIRYSNSNDHLPLLLKRVKSCLKLLIKY